MPTHIDTVIAEVRNSLKGLDTSGLIDDLTMYDLAFKALKRFGNLITTLHETVIRVQDGRAELPINFHNLKVALKCDRSHYSTDCEKDELQTSFMWKERTEKTDSWNECADCDKTYSEKTIIEKVYLHGKETRFSYKSPTLLKLGRHSNKNFVGTDCQNKSVKECPYEITINNRTLYANFTDGNIYIKYYGLETDDDGKPYIPETPFEGVEKYVRASLEMSIFKDLWLNGDDAGIENKLQFLVSQEDKALSFALLDAKAATLTLNGFKNLERQNKKRSSVFELHQI